MIDVLFVTPPRTPPQQRLRQFLGQAWQAGGVILGGFSKRKAGDLKNMWESQNFLFL